MIMPIIIGTSVIALGFLANTFFGNTDTSRPAPKRVVEEDVKISAPSALPNSETPFKSGDNGVLFDLSAKNQIVLEGEITPMMAASFKAALASSYLDLTENPLLVFLNSKGGDLYAAMDIGRAIRANKSSVTVVRPKSECYSSCVFILLAGEQRGLLGRIGIHRPYSLSPTESAQATEQIFTKVSADAKSYLREMRVRDGLFDDMVNIPPSAIHVFSSINELQKYGILIYDPIIEETAAATNMKHYRITDRQVYNQRWHLVQSVCMHLSSDWDAQGCMDRVMNGGTP